MSEIARYTFGYVDIEVEEGNGQELQMIPTKFGEAVKYVDYLAALAEKDKEIEALKDRIQRLTVPAVYEGAHYSTVEVPEICPVCDGRNFISHGTRGIVCYICWLTAALDESETNLIHARAEVERLKRTHGPTTPHA